MAPSVIDNATSSDSLQPKRAQLYQVLLVFSSALVECAIQPVRDVEDLEKLSSLETGSVLPLGTSSSGFDGLGYDFAAGWRLFVFDIGTHFD